MVLRLVVAAQVSGEPLLTLRLEVEAVPALDWSAPMLLGGCHLLPVRRRLPNRGPRRADASAEAPGEIPPRDWLVVSNPETVAREPVSGQASQGTW
mgnify:CR=1 FL=1